MYNISRWASRNVWAARLLLVSGLVLLTALALFTGNALQVLDINLSPLFFYAAAGLFLVLFLGYPNKFQQYRTTHFYRFQKTVDALLLATTFILIVCIGNRPSHFIQTVSLAQAATLHSTATTGFEKERPGILPTPKMKSIQLVKHPVVKLLQHVHKHFKKLNSTQKTLWTILAIAVALVLLTYLSALSCSISCSGAEGLAALVLVLGYGIVIFALARVLRRIYKGPRRKKIISQTG